VVKVDPQTIDLHFALGNLFRRQGEIDRAIRMHQNLLDRPDLAADKRQTAVFELAQDFHRAGLLDRAEDMFSKLDGSPFELQSIGFLLQIFEQEKDWQKAIAVTKRMEALAKRPYFKEIAHYYCELAQSAMLRSQLDDARPSTRRSPSPGCTAGGDAARRHQASRATTRPRSRRSGVSIANPPSRAGHDRLGTAGS
jgi:lipopolysaccharide biosynthesis regulator YciM